MTLTKSGWLVRGACANAQDGAAKAACLLGSTPKTCANYGASDPITCLRAFNAALDDRIMRVGVAADITVLPPGTEVTWLYVAKPPGGLTLLPATWAFYDSQNPPGTGPPTPMCPNSAYPTGGGEFACAWTGEVGSP